MADDEAVVSEQIGSLARLTRKRRKSPPSIACNSACTSHVLPFSGNFETALHRLLPSISHSRRPLVQSPCPSIDYCPVCQDAVSDTIAFPKLVRRDRCSSK
jgi:hypothetical protein